MKKLFTVLLVSILAVSLMTACSSDTNTGGTSSSNTNSSQNNGGSQSTFKPERDVEFVVPYSAGGGSDIFARTVAQIMQENKFVDKNILVLNKAGGSGAVGNAYTFGKKGDSHTIMTWVAGQQASAVVNNADVRLEHLTPIATLALDSFLIVVDKDSKYQTFEELIEAAKAAPDTITVGGSGAGNEDHLLFHLINKHYGTKFKYVAFNSGGEQVSALLGGHIDMIIMNPNEILPQIEAGEARALASTAEERLPSPLDQVPTFKELGKPEVQLVMFRAVIGPPDMPAEAVKYWEDVLKKVTESQEWQENYLKKFNLINYFKGAEESKPYFEEVLNQYLEIHKELGTYKP